MRISCGLSWTAPLLRVEAESGGLPFTGWFTLMGAMPTQLPLRLKVDDPARPPVTALLERHLAEMHATSPPGSVYALDVEGLRVPQVTFWTGCTDERGAEVLVACGALKELDATHAEIKSMHTHSDWRGQGFAARFVGALIDEAKSRGYSRLSLETGAFESFAGARRLYARHGFEPCGAFGDYGPDPHSAFMTLELAGGAE